MLAIEQNFDGLHDSILDLLAENAFVDVDIHRYKNLITKIENKESAIVYLIHLGYLSYQEFDDKSNKISIPNEEVRQEFIREIEGMDYSWYDEYLQKSAKIFDALLNCDADAVALGLEDCHDEVIPQKYYNSELSLRYAVKHAFYAAKAKYNKPLDEDTTGKGIADVVYLPKDRFKLTDPAIIIELKWNKDTQTAIKQIEDKQYTAKYANYGNGFLLVGINYDTKTKKHSCEIKRLEKI